MSPAFSFFPLAFFPLTKLVPSPSGLPATTLVPIPSGFPATKFPLPCGPVLGVFPAVGECWRDDYAAGLEYHGFASFHEQFPLQLHVVTQECHVDLIQISFEPADVDGYCTMLQYWIMTW